MNTSTVMSAGWNNGTLNSLVDGVTTCHKRLVNEALPSIADLINALPEDANGQFAVREEVVAAFKNLRGVLERHVDQEDRIVMKLIRSLGDAERLNVFHCRAIARPIGAMVHEHKNIWAAVDSLRHVAEEYVYDTQAAMPGVHLLDGIGELEGVMQSCFNAEEKVVYPKAIAREILLTSRAE